MKKIIISVSIFLFAAGCVKQPAVLPTPIQNQPAQTQPATSTPEQATTTPLSLPIKYDNKEFGFIFSLPQDWKDFSVYEKNWTGQGPNDSHNLAQGPVVYIRHPKWSAQNPYEDIPIMVFTLDQWNQIQQEKLSVSAAPFPPSELGRNKIYVFALPPRFDYDFRTGFEEVEKIMQSSPLVGY